MFSITLLQSAFEAEPGVAGLSVIAGVLLALAMDYLPGFKDWFDRQSKNGKRLTVAVLTLLAAAGLYGFSCYGTLPPGAQAVACGETGVWALFWSWVYTLGSSQGMYLLSPARDQA